MRYVLHDRDEQALARLGARHNAPGTWIKAATEPAYLRAALPPEWKTAEPCYLMTAAYRAASDEPSPPYTTSVQIDGQVISAAILGHEGQIAASGRLAVAGPFGIVDQVETAPEHRRRGLGSAVMRTLALHGLQFGADSGVLVATDDGRHLYETLGWRVAAPIAAAYVPEQ
ncbi:GNAT family N-acetyltransferase [Actinoplanes solisilvae]|uniref:GNAT family N-acetyltransferase n=1 Tax=Actinoplanes solisilvae TaxID=2486853 RepID=UPI000FDAAEC6|nr:GNAT family N-acetyltransferase [Actinoplanes solisilvae]